MPKDGHSGVVAGGVLDPVAQFPGGHDTLRQDDQRMGFALFTGLVEAIDEPSQAELDLRHDHGFCPPGHGHVEGQKARTPTHDLDYEEPVMAGGRVAQAHDGIEGGLHGGAESYGEFRPGDVVVDRPGDARHGDAPLLQFPGSLEGPAAADDGQALYPGAEQIVGGPVLPLGLHEAARPGSLQDRPASVDDAAHITGPEGAEVALQEPLEAAHDADGLHVLGDGAPGDGPYGGVHARGVPSAGEDGYFFHRGHGKASFPQLKIQ